MERMTQKNPLGLAAVHAARIADLFAHARSMMATPLPWPASWELKSEQTAAASEECPRILLLTSSLGYGHVRAALAIEAALRERLPGAVVRTLDFWSLMDDRVAWAVRSTYLQLIEQHPLLFDRIYRLDQRTWRDILESREPLPASIAEVAALVPPTSGAMSDSPRDAWHPSDRLLLRLLGATLSSRARGMPGNGRLLRLALVSWTWRRLARRLAQRVQAFDPHAIIATQMNPAALLSSAKRRRSMDVPTICVATDFGLHDFWIQPGVDRYCVAHESIARAQRQRLDANKVLATGIPLMPGFLQPPAAREARQALGLDTDSPVVLVAGGGLGLGVDAAAEKLLTSPLRLQILAVAAHNSTTHRCLSALAEHHRGRIWLWEWTERMELLIRAADIVVGKPGGLTVAEALACGRPLIATRALRGQEGFNVRFLEEHEVGRLVSENDLVAAIDALLADRLLLTRMQERAWLLGRRDGADRIAELALSLAGPRVRREVRRR
jgi:processive 1,2-diacylglycerol beta-glucosyltransferase